MNWSPTTKRYVFIGLVAIAALQFYLGSLISPLATARRGLRERIIASEKAIQEHEKSINGLNAAISAEKAMQKQEALASRILATVPASPMVECSILISDTAMNALAQRVNPRISYMLPVKGAPNRILYGWNLAMSSTSSVKVGQFLAAMEERLPLSQVTKLTLVPAPGKSEIAASMEICIAGDPL